MKVRRRESPGCADAVAYVAQLAWFQNSEFQDSTCEEFIERVVQSLPDSYIELTGVVYTGLVDLPVAYANITEDDDMHYGKCASVQWNYCNELYRGSWFRQVYKELLRFAKERGIPYIAYTQKTGVREYRTIYRKV